MTNVVDKKSQPSAQQTPAQMNRRLPLDQFLWGAGIECSFIPHLNVDQFQWTQHNRFWKDDFKRAKDELGITHLRYALPWHQLEPAPGIFDWKMADERLNAAHEMGLEIMLDCMHFGCPLWLKQAAGDPEFPESLERFTTALVERYRDIINIWSPCNEPLVLALFSGDFGFWPPHARKWRGYMPVLSRVVQGVNRAIRAIRRAMPEATVLLCDAAETFKTHNEELQTEVDRRNLRRFLVMDLLLGRVDGNHPLYNWLNSYGMSELDLDWFQSNPQSPDVLGLDYYPHSDWQLDQVGDSARQRRADKPIGLFGVANAYWERYGVPLMLTETSIEGQPINREIWFESVVEDTCRLREQGVPMLGLMWWPMIDQVDWDGALTHRIGKVHEVGLFNLKRQPDGTLARFSTPLVKRFKEYAAAGEEKIGVLGEICYPSPEATDEQLPPIGQWIQPQTATAPSRLHTESTNGNGKGNATARRGRLSDHATLSESQTKQTDGYGIVVFCHLRWGFVWQRPQQFLSRFARKHPILFIEEPAFDRPEGGEPDVQYHRVMPNVTVVCPHLAPSWNRDPRLPEYLRQWTTQAMERMNENGCFDAPLLWYYSPMDASWSLGAIPNRGVVYDCMDELANFSGAPKQLIENEKRLMQFADIVFTGGYEMGEKRKKAHPNVHIFGCGVEFDHFNRAQDPTSAIPPDIDFMARPILGWFGVVDERVDYGMVGQMSRMRPDWSFAMVGPVVKVDPNLLPHSPNLFWMGGRDYQQLPNYCAAFDVCMMPFANNASTQYINPTKGLEYMATGKPIISTPIKDVIRQWSDIVYIASSAEEFVAAAEKAMENSDQDRIRKGLELAKKSGWESTVQSMQDLISTAIAARDRRSGGKIKPLVDAELEYQYRSTPGS